MQYRTYNSILKIVFITYGGLLIGTGLDFELNKSVSSFIIPLITMYILFAFRTYKITLNTKNVVIHKVFTNDLCVKGEDINKIELEAIEVGNGCGTCSISIQKREFTKQVLLGSVKMIY